MVFALSTESMVALAVMAAIFIGFSLFSSFYFPARDPDFPGKKWRNGYIVDLRRPVRDDDGHGAHLREGRGRGARRGRGAETTRASRRASRPRRTRRRETNARRPGRTRPPATQLRARSSSRARACGSCHTMAAADATGAVGPNLDEAKPDEALIARPRGERQGRDAGLRGSADRAADRRRRRVRPASRRSG